MPIRLLYIDDETSSRSQAFADGLNTNNTLQIEIDKPTNFETLISELIQKQNEFDGLILDLRLDGNQNGDRVAKYTAPSLAQGIRSKVHADNGFIKEFPIFLISSSDNLNKYYNPDSSSHDLFDFLISKTDIANSGDFFEKVIGSIVNSYSILDKNKPNYKEILNCDFFEEIEDRIFTTRYLSNEGVLISEASQYILNEIILKSGVLIDEYVLAARLGVDIGASKNNWEILLNLIDAKYEGIFSDNWDRWWSSKLLDWWNKNFNDLLIRLTAKERVELLSKEFNLPELVAAEPIDKTTSSKFWTICQAYKRPLDPKDGFVVDGMQLYTWQDKKYISLQSILEREAKDLGLTIHPAERERFDELKANYA